jgi:uncharacterized protein YfdQ (DUF2303 family)
MQPFAPQKAVGSTDAVTAPTNLMFEPGVSDVGSALAFSRLHTRASVVDSIESDPQKGLYLVDVPAGRNLVNLTAAEMARRSSPSRVVRATAVYDVESFLALLKLQAGHVTTVYATPLQIEPNKASLVAVCNDDRNLEPQWREVSITYAPQLSAEWEVWARIDGKKLSQGDLAEFLEDNIADVLPLSVASAETLERIALAELKLAGSAALNALARNVKINADVKVHQAVTTSSGEIAIAYSEVHRSDIEGAPVTVPTAFLIGIPVFFNGPRYQMLVRLRYKLQGGALVWSLVRYDADRIQDAAFAEIVTDVAARCGHPVLLGAAPAPAKPI